MNATTPMIACSRMYNVTPAARDAWRSLFLRVSEMADVALDVIDHQAPAPLESLWERDDLGCVFMCGWPFTRARPRPRIVAAPVPAAPRYGNRPVYFSDFIVLKDKGYRSLADTFGGRLAWTVSGSHSGFNAPRHHLLERRDSHRPVLYPDAVGPLITPLGALDSITDNRADVAALDSFALDLIRRHEPDRLADVVVLESTASAPIPPLIASPGIDEQRVEAIRAALLEAASRPELSAVLTRLAVAGFAVPGASDYDVIAARDEQARSTGYPFPG